MDSFAFFRSRREQVLPQRGHAFRPHHGTAAEINVVEISERRARLGTVGRSGSTRFRYRRAIGSSRCRGARLRSSAAPCSRGGLDSLGDEFAVKGTSAPVVVDVADKEPLLALVTAWIEAVGEKRAVARGGLLDLRDALRADLENPPPDLAGVN
jgi:hypothetical protein